MSLFQILTTEGENHFIFRRGLHPRLIVKGHQLPMKQSYLDKHAKALHAIKLLSHTEKGITFHLVSAKSQGQIERNEYLIKRAILELSESYGWEVKQ